MPANVYTGPLISTGGILAPGGSVLPGSQYSDQPGPSSFAHGVGLVDSRYFPLLGGDISNVMPIWYTTNDILVIDQVPSQLSATNIVAAAVPVSGTPMTLAGASTGITVVPTGGFSLGGAFPTVPAASLVLDGNPALIQLQSGTTGPAGGISMYDPRTTIARNVRITTAGNETSNSAAVIGYDWFGQIMHETITLGTAGVYSGKKAFKFITSVTINGTLSGSNVSAGTGDVYGFPLASWEFDLVNIQWNAALITATTGYTSALTPGPSTATSNDVRGTYAVQSASDGTKKLFVQLIPAPWQLTQAGLFGVVQF